MSDEVQIRCDDGADSQRAAAGIWARATAQRDKLEVPAPVEEKLRGIRQALTNVGASLHVAYRTDETLPSQLPAQALGFVLLVPREGALEVLYLGVDPVAWGRGVASSLLHYVEEHARETGRGSLELWVIDDNERAVQVYERSGWRRTDDVKVRNASGRPERRFER